ncbi:MAG: cytochrome c-type biogenesis protein CcmH [candidate division Zixibacteria bacterium]|nr:cytochrome c-type biogenesis protein CcmH [candidate division Zixibacteria bacterium]
MNGQKSGSVNVVLMALVGVLVGFIGGYWIGQHSQVGVAVQAANLATANNGETFCPYALDAKDEWILAGFRCPNTDTVQASLLGCHCSVAHGIKDKVKKELAAGKGGQQIRDEMIAEYGNRLKFRGQ